MAEEKLVSMKIDPKEREARYAEAAKPSDGPAYPYGLCLHLDDEAMKKLAMKELPKVGKQVMIHALADVVSVRESESIVGGPSQSVELQITDLAIEKVSEKKSDEEALYSKA